jgi:AraC family transcriptional regulator of adaptative response / DNA-3-methyladenine glycosylase II
VKTRQAAIQTLASAVATGQLCLDAGVDIHSTVLQLHALPGIGDWTAQYIAMRALRWPDAFPAGDVALHKALGLMGQPKPAQAALAASQGWQPWRAYAVIRAWARLPNATNPHSKPALLLTK